MPKLTRAERRASTGSAQARRRGRRWLLPRVENRFARYALWGAAQGLVAAFVPLGGTPPRIWLLGAPILLAFLLYHPSPMLVVVAVIAIPQLLAAWRYDPNLPANQAYYGRIDPGVKLEYTVLYLALVALLAIMTSRVHDMLTGVAG